MPTENAQADIPFGVIEYTAHFKRPIISAWTVPGATVDVILTALEPWGFKIEGAELKTQTEKLNDYAMVFKRTPPGVTFSVGTSKLVVNAENLDWTEAQHFIEGVSVGIGALNTACSRMNQLFPNAPEIKSQQLLCALHIQLRSKRREEVTAHLLTPDALQLLDGELTFPGIILHRKGASIIIDSSAVYANAIFVRMMREHPPEMTLQQIAEVLRKDEEELLEVLGIEGVL